MKTGALAPITKKPNRAGSPTRGSRLNSGSVTVTYPSTPTQIVTLATPTAVPDGHAFATPRPSRFVKNCAAVHRGIAVGLPIRPGGHLKLRSLTSPTAAFTKGDSLLR